MWKLPVSPARSIPLHVCVMQKNQPASTDCGSTSDDDDDDGDDGDDTVKMAKIH